MGATLALSSFNKVDPFGSPPPVPAQQGFVDLIASDRHVSRLAQAVMKAPYTTVTNSVIHPIDRVLLP